MQGADGHDHDHEHGSHDDHDDHDHDHEEDEHDSDEVEYDEHIWTSPKNAVVLCRAVCDAICKADPANEDFYRANCDDYCAQIEALDARFADLAKSLGTITRDQTGYLVTRTDVEAHGLCPECQAKLGLARKKRSA